jgi:hypothetical protein
MFFVIVVSGLAALSHAVRRVFKPRRNDRDKGDDPTLLDEVAA